MRKLREHHLRPIATIARASVKQQPGIAIVGMLAAVIPDSAVLRALNEVTPQLATVIPIVISACGTVVAALSQPPRLGRRGKKAVG